MLNPFTSNKCIGSHLTYTYFKWDVKDPSHMVDIYILCKLSIYLDVIYFLPIHLLHFSYKKRYVRCTSEIENKYIHIFPPSELLPFSWKIESNAFFLTKWIKCFSTIFFQNFKSGHIYIWKIRNVLKQMKNLFSDFLFMRYRHYCTQIG